MKIGYAHVSTSDQTLQQDALKAAGCTRVITDDGVIAREAR